MIVSNFQRRGDERISRLFQRHCMIARKSFAAFLIE